MLCGRAYCQTCCKDSDTLASLTPDNVWQKPVPDVAITDASAATEQQLLDALLDGKHIDEDEDKSCPIAMEVATHTLVVTMTCLLLTCVLVAAGDASSEWSNDISTSSVRSESIGHAHGGQLTWC